MEIYAPRHENLYTEAPEKSEEQIPSIETLDQFQSVMLFIMMCVSVDDRNQSKNLTYGHFLPLHLRFPKERTLYPALVIHTHIKQGGDFFGPRSPLIFQFSNPSFQLSFLKSHFSNTITSQLTLLKNIRFSLLNTHFSTHSYLLRFVSAVLLDTILAIFMLRRHTL